MTKGKMTNLELNMKRLELANMAEDLKKTSPMLAMGEFKKAAELMAEITNELVWRELAQYQKEPEKCQTKKACKGCPDCKKKTEAGAT